MKHYRSIPPGAHPDFYEVNEPIQIREDDEMYQNEDNPYNFRDPGGRSALRNGKRSFPCPTCKRENVLTRADVNHGYQCDRCADAAEGYFAGEY